MAGTDDKYIWQLPDTTGLKHEVIMVGDGVRLIMPSASRERNSFLLIFPKKSLTLSMRTRR